MFQVLFGFLPWMTFWVFSGMDNWPAAILGAFFVAAGVILWRWRSHHNFKTMELVSLGYFAVHAVVTLGMKQQVLIYYGPAINGLVLAGMAWGTLLMGSPFTYQYAKEDWPEAYWGDPLFVRTNQIITAVWGSIFLVTASLGALGIAFPDYNLLLNVIFGNLFIGSGIVFSSVFPGWYTKYAIQKELDEGNPYQWPEPVFDSPRAQPDEHDVIIIGSGIGGLTAGALLAQRGLNVAVFEQHFLAGGFCTSWERGVRQKDGSRWRYVFDAGVHDVSGLGPRGPVRNMLQQLGVWEKLDWRHMAHEYHLDGIDMRVPRDVDAFVDKLGELFPHEAEAIRAFFTEMRHIYDDLYADVDETGGAPMPPKTVKEMLDYPIRHPHAYRWRMRSFGDMLDTFFEDVQLKRFLSLLTAYLTDDPTQLHVETMAPIFGYYFDGGFYPAGGSQKLADVLVAAIQHHGGQLFLRTPVKEILIEQGRAAGVVLGKDGSVHRAPAIISNADLKKTFLDLVDESHLPKDFRARIAGGAASTSAFMVFLGVDFIPDVAPLTMTGDLGIMIPSKADPSLAPRGHAAITLITLIPQSETASWQRKTKGYQARKRAFGDALIARAEKLIPGLSQHIIYRQEGSPRTFERYAWTTDGSIYGPALDAWRPPMKSPIPGLYLAGSGVFPGPGIEAVVISGVLAADTIYPATK